MRRDALHFFIPSSSVKLTTPPPLVAKGILSRCQTNRIQNLLSPSGSALMKRLIAAFAVVAMFVNPFDQARSVVAEEGMYLVDELPLELWRDRYDFEPAEGWAEHLRLSSVRFNSGGSGSFISSDGLVLTNHHVASDTLQKLSSADRNLLQDGFLAADRSEELKAPDLELNQLVSIEDMTARVQSAVPEGLASDEAAKRRRAELSKIETESLEATGLRSDVVELYGGAAYHLYRYKRFTDVRLVWAPEVAAAFFGGDADNFEYPRYNLDATIFRVYEDGEAAKLENFLRLSESPVQPDDLVFVSGHPGRTQRIFTTAALRYLRDHRIPYVLDLLRRKEVLMQQYSLGGPESRRQARDELFGIQNARKAYTGMLAGLMDPAIFARKVQREEALIATDGEAGERIRESLRNVEAIVEDQRDLLGKQVGLRSDLFETALTLVMLAEESTKANEDRLREYSDARRESLLRKLLSPAPIYPDLEIVKLADELMRLAENRSADDELVTKLLGTESPRQRATQWVLQTKLMDVEVRKTLAEGGLEAVNRSEDPLIQAAKTLAPVYREIRERSEAVDERETQAYAALTAALSEASDAAEYPDATFTLRIAFGVVKGYEEDGKFVPPITQIGGAFEHAELHAGQDDFELPESWHEAKLKLDLATPLNFVCTADIIGGNSGSPVVNRDGELVGLIFDGNIQSLVADYMYDDKQARAVSVAAPAITEAIRVIYQAPELADSIGR